MNAFPILVPGRSKLWTADAEALRVVVLYDQTESSGQAHDAVTGITVALRGRRRVDSSLWSFDMLARLDIRHASVRGAADADALIVVGNVTVPLPPHVGTWLMACIQENSKGVPLVAACCLEHYQQAGALPALRKDLLAIANRWHAPLLNDRELTARLCQKRTPRPSIVQASRGREEWESLLAAPQRRGWGIND